MISQITRKASLAFLFLIATLACVPLFAADKTTSALPTPTETFLTVAEATPTVESLPVVASPISPVPAEPTAPTLPAPAVDFAALARYQQAMLPGFAGDIERVAAAGASHYYLEVSIQPESFNSPEGLLLQGTVSVFYTNKEDRPLSDIYFHLYPNLPGYGGQMRIQAVAIDDQDATWEMAAEDDALRLSLPAPLPLGASTNITLNYEALVRAHPQQGYNIFSFTDGTAALAGFYPAVAVYDEEGWNIETPPIYGDAIYLDIALYQVKLTVPAGMIVAASGSLADEAVHSDGTKTLTFASGPIREFYLAMRNDFGVISETVDGIMVNSYYPPELEADGKLALQYAVDSLRVFNKSFGPYPYAELDVVATPTTAGGVEYPGIVVIAENVYTQNGIFFPHVVAHEVAHQWWYGMVGSDQVDEPWLDESLTNYSTILYWEETAGEETATDVIDTFFLGPYRRAQNQEADQRVLGSVFDYTQSDYSTFIYGKGPLFFDALRREVGKETYLEIMQRYFNDYKYGIARTEDLLGTIETVSGRNITPLVETWLEVK